MSSNTPTTNTVTNVDENGVKTTVTTRTYTDQATDFPAHHQSTKDHQYVYSRAEPQIIRTSTEKQVYHTTAPTQTIRTVAPTIYRTANDTGVTSTTVNGSNVIRKSEGVVVNSTPTTQTYVTRAPTTTTQTYVSPSTTTETYVTRAPTTTTETYVTRAPTQTYIAPTTSTQTYVSRAPETIVTRVPTTTTQTYVSTAPVQRVIQSSPVRETVVRSTPIQRSPEVAVKSSSNLNNSVIKIDDDARYKINAEEQHGYGRSNIKSRYGTQTRVYNNRTHTDLRDPIVTTKKNSSEYRNDNDCNMI